jgi:hypothetical protein
LKNTRLIGRECKHSNVFSRPVLICRGLDLRGRRRAAEEVRCGRVSS